MGSIVWGVPPPAFSTIPGVGLICLKAPDSVTCAVLGPVVGVMTHFVNGRTVPCTGSKHCEVHYLEQEWKGYLPCFALNRTWKGVRSGHWASILVVSKGIGVGVAACPRGSLITVSRTGGKPNDPLSLEIKGEWKSDIPLPESFDVKPYVERAVSKANQNRLRIKTA